MNSISIYSVLTTKKFIKHPLCLLLALTFTRWCLCHKTPAAVSQNIWTPFSTVLVFHLGNILMEIFAIFIGEGYRVLRIKVQMGTQKMNLILRNVIPVVRVELI